MVDKIVGGRPQNAVKPIASQNKEVKSRQDGTLLSRRSVSFEEVLKDKEINVSGHARQRLQSRNIAPNQDIAGRLENAVSKAKLKGARECVVLVDDVAYLVSIQNRTIVTAIGKDELRERLFTSIDSMIIG